MTRCGKGQNHPVKRPRPNSRGRCLPANLPLPRPRGQRPPTAPTEQQEPVRALQVPLLLAEHAVDAPAHPPRLTLGLALLGAQLVRPPPPLLLRAGFGPRACRAPAGAPRGPEPGRVCCQGPGRRGTRAVRGLIRGGVLRVSEEQRPQAVAQTHVGAAGLKPGHPRKGARGLHPDPARRGRPYAAGCESGGCGPTAAAPHGPRGPLCILRRCRGWQQPGLEVT